MTEQDRIRDLEAKVAELQRIVMTSVMLAAPKPDGPFTIKRAAHLARKSEATVRRWCKDAPWAFRVGGTWEIDRNKFVAAMARDLFESEDA